MDGTPLNTDDTAEAANLYYGQIRHPTIEDIAVMLQEFWVEAKKRNPSLRYADLRMWKMDLKGAYTLLSFRPEDVGLFAMLLTGDLVYFQLAGIFGWTGLARPLLSRSLLERYHGSSSTQCRVILSCM